MTTMIPDRSIDQRMAALNQANAVRSRRARCKREIRDGSEDLGTLLSLPPDWLLTAKVFNYVLEVPTLGQWKVTNLFSRAGISPVKTFGGLSDRQRRVLLDALSGLLAAGGRR